MARSVNAIDEELAALERALATLSSDEEDEGGVASTSDSREERKQRKKRKKEKRARGRTSSDEEAEAAPDVLVGGEDLPRIQPLPRELLPEGNDYKGKGTSFLGKRGAGQPTASAASGGTTTAGAPRNELERRLAMRNDRPRCEVCQMDFTSGAQFEEHKRGKKHLAKARAANGGGGGGRGAGGGRRYVKPPPGPHCELCRKIFTSEVQKVEHYGGKWHKARERGEMPPSNRPYS